MTSIPDSVKATLDAGWSAAGGAEPTYYVAEDFRTDPPLGKDSIWIPTGTLRTRIEPVNDTYSNKMHTLDILVNTQTDEDRLKEIADEVERILNATAITGATYQKVIDRKSNVGQYKGIWVYQEILTVDIREHLAASASSYGAGSVTLLDSLMMYGSANAALVPLAYSLPSTVGQDILSGALGIDNVSGSDHAQMWTLPMPTNKGTLKLYISGYRIDIQNADADDFISNFSIYGLDFDSGTRLFDEPTDRTTAPAQINDIFVAVDCSAYTMVIAYINCTVATAGDLGIRAVAIKCYYDT